MTTLKTLTLTVISTILLGSSFLSGGNTAAGQQPKQPRTSIEVHRTTQAEYQNMRRPAAGTQVTPAQRAAIRAVEPAVEICPYDVIGEVTVAGSQQTCTYQVIRVSCSYGSYSDVTVMNCTIN